MTYFLIGAWTGCMVGVFALAVFNINKREQD